MVCAQDVPRAVRQLQKVRALGFAGIEIGTHINGAALGSEKLWPLYQAAEALDLSIFIHPLHPAGMDRIGAGPELAATAAFPLETALAAVSLLAAQITDRYPRLKVLLSHGGGALSWILPRLDFGWSIGLQGQMKQPASNAARKFWYDTILYDPASLRFLSKAVGIDHIVVGSDYPFAIRQKRPGEFARNALDDEAVLNANAFKFLGRTYDIRELASYSTQSSAPGGNARG